MLTLVKSLLLSVTVVPVLLWFSALWKCLQEEFVQWKGWKMAEPLWTAPFQAYSHRGPGGLKPWTWTRGLSEYEAAGLECW